MTGRVLVAVGAWLAAGGALLVAVNVWRRLDARERYIAEEAAEGAQEAEAWANRGEVE